MSSSPAEDIEDEPDSFVDHNLLTANMEIDQSFRIHEILKCVLKGNYLAPLKKDIKRCLELGYSSGILMMELACEFENCEFYGLDKKPNAPSEIHPPNCHFEKEDFYQGIHYPDEHFDYVYLRCTMAFIQKDKYDLLLGELHRVLKKGGWIEFTELDHECRPRGPLCKSLEDIWHSKIQEENADPKKFLQIDSILPEKGFTSVKVQTFDIPVGDHGGKIGIDTANFWREWAHMQKDYVISKIGDKDQKEYDEFIEKTVKEFDEYHSSITAYNFVAQKV